MENASHTSVSETKNNQEEAPNNIGILILGVLSIVPGTISFGLLGIILGIVTLSLAAGTNEAINKHPEKYTASSIRLVKTGKICGIIGLVLSALIFISLIIMAISYSSSLMGNPDFYL